MTFRHQRHLTTTTSLTIVITRVSDVSEYPSKMARAETYISSNMHAHNGTLEDRSMFHHSMSEDRASNM